MNDPLPFDQTIQEKFEIALQAFNRVFGPKPGKLIAWYLGTSKMLNKGQISLFTHLIVQHPTENQVDVMIATLTLIEKGRNPYYVALWIKGNLSYDQL